MTKGSLRLCHLYPAWLNLCGERASILVWQQRCQWRGWQLAVHTVDQGTPFDPDACDLVLLGGGDAAAHQAVQADLATGKGDAIRAAVAAGVVFLCLGGGMQLLGRSFVTTDGTIRPGLGILNIEARAARRRSGAVVADSEVLRDAGRERLLVGFANHPARIDLGAGMRPLARVGRGAGNNGRDGTEGVVAGSIYGTSIQGGLLANNPDLADHLLALAVQRRDGAASEDFAPGSGVEEPFTRAARAYYLTKNR